MARVAVAVDGDDPGRRAAAKALAHELGLPLMDMGNGLAGFAELLLVVRERRLELLETGIRRSRPLFVDFVGGPTGYRRRSAASRRQPLAMAVGVRRGPLTVVDATAGLGRDSFLLACLGCAVVAVERCAVLGALLRDGLARAKGEGRRDISSIVDRITLVIGDARDVLGRMSAADAPDVVYVDPMYPPRLKATLPKKELRICRWLVGDDPDAGELLAVARNVARNRVVVKRHPHSAPLAEDYAIQFRGKMTRYDVYTTNK